MALGFTGGSIGSFRRPGTPTSSPTLGFSPTPTTNTQKAFDDFSSIFGPPAPLDPNRVATDVQGFINQNMPPPITPPVVPVTQIQLPGGTFEGLQQNLFESQFAPVQRELERQAGAQDAQLNAMLAQAGLADSGTGVGQRVALADEFGRRAEAAARDISAASTATAFNAQIQVASANAQMAQQVNLANAGFNLTAQVENARNILAGNTTAAQAYLTALGLNAEQANAYRQSFLAFLGIQEQARLQSDRLSLEAASTMLNFQLQQRGLDLQQFEIESNQELNKFKLAIDQENNHLDFQAALAQAGGTQEQPSGTFSLAQPGILSSVQPSFRPSGNLPSLGTSGGGISSAGDIQSFLSQQSPLTSFSRPSTVEKPFISSFDSAKLGF